MCVHEHTHICIPTNRIIYMSEQNALKSETSFKLSPIWMRDKCHSIPWQNLQVTHLTYWLSFFQGGSYKGKGNGTGKWGQIQLWVSIVHYPWLHAPVHTVGSITTPLTYESVWHPTLQAMRRQHQGISYNSLDGIWAPHLAVCWISKALCSFGDYVHHPI